MKKLNNITTSRIEAFSDGVIAIIITVMIFDIKLNALPSEENIWTLILELLPRILSYIFSFLVVAIMWVNHHQLFHQIRHTDRILLWLNMLLLFWMSLIPFATNLLGANPKLPESYFFYGTVFAFCATSFTFLRSHLVRKNLLHETISLAAQKKVKKKNLVAIGIYLLSAFTGYVSVYVSMSLLLIVPLMYFIPEKIIHKNETI